MKNIKFNKESSLRLASELGKLAVENDLFTHHADPEDTAKDVANFILTLADELSSDNPSTQQVRY